MRRSCWPSWPSWRSRSPAAILLAAVCNLLGPLLLGAAVADTIAGIVEVTPAQTVVVVGAALTAAVVWNLVTWWRGLPSSSSHALVGGLSAPRWWRRGLGRSTGAASAAAIRPVSSGPWWRWRSRRCSAAVILVASLVGAPASTTQVVSSSVVGVGVGRRRYRHVGWEVVGSILLAWVTTFPAAAVLAALLVPLRRRLP